MPSGETVFLGCTQSTFCCGASCAHMVFPQCVGRKEEGQRERSLRGEGKRGVEKDKRERSRRKRGERDRWGVEGEEEEEERTSTCYKTTNPIRLGPHL